jgi:hypothetical protein
MGILDRDLVISALQNGRFDELVGEFENEWLECKGQPYDLTREDQKLELAKDITGLANAGGGLLLLGYSTKRSDIHGEDQIHEVRAFPDDRFNQSQYDSAIKSWIYPPIDGLEIVKFTTSLDPLYIVVCIKVPKVIGPNSPVLVAKTMLDSNRKIENLVGYFVRKQSHVAHYDIKRIQALFRDGLRYDADIRENFSALHNAIESLRENSNTQAAAIPAQEVSHNIDEALAAVQLREEPSIVLTAVPSRPLNLGGLFESNSSELVRLIERPPEVRSSGFNLGTGERSKIIKGKIRRAVEVGYKEIEVHRNGVVIFVSDGGSNGLCWGRPARQQQSFLINQIALIEYVYLFCGLAHSVQFSQMKENEKVVLGAELSNLSMNGTPPRLEPGYPDSYGLLNAAKSAPEGSGKFTCEIDLSVSSERAAFLLLSEIYIWFGIETDKIPLTKLNPKQERIVDRDALLQFH